MPVLDAIDYLAATVPGARSDPFWATRFRKEVAAGRASINDYEYLLPKDTKSAPEGTAKGKPRRRRPRAKPTS